MSTTVARVQGVGKRFTVNANRSLKENAFAVVRRRSVRQDFWALRDIDLEIEAGTTVGLIGHNGSGKSTLLKVIGGILTPTTGVVERRGRLAALLELGAGFHPDLTGRENIYLNASILGLSRRETAENFDAIVDFSGIGQFIDTQVKFYSSGMWVRLGFATAVHVDPDLLLVDEVLAVGDEPFQRKCMAKIRDFQRDGRTIVLVSHSADQVSKMCDRVAVLDSGRKVFDGAAAEGLAVLRDKYHAQELEEAATPQTAPKVSIIESRCSVVTRDGEPHVVIRTEVELLATLPSWGLALHIDTDSGFRLFSYDSLIEDAPLPSRPGKHFIEIDFPASSFGMGTYVIDVAATGARGKVHDQLSRATSFTIADRGAGTGAMRLHPRVVDIAT